MRFRPISVLAIWTSLLSTADRAPVGAVPSRGPGQPSGGLKPPRHETNFGSLAEPERSRTRVPYGRHDGPKRKAWDRPVEYERPIARPRDLLQLDLGADLLEGRADLLGLVLGHGF